jgi:hypothetical protein
VEFDRRTESETPLVLKDAKSNREAFSSGMKAGSNSELHESFAIRWVEEALALSPIEPFCEKVWLDELR